MSNYTYVGNRDPHENTGAIVLRNGDLILKIGYYADLTPEEVASLINRFDLQAGIVGPAVAAPGPPAQSRSYIADADGNILSTSFDEIAYTDEEGRYIGSQMVARPWGGDVADPLDPNDSLARVAELPEIVDTNGAPVIGKRLQVVVNDAGEIANLITIDGS